MDIYDSVYFRINKRMLRTFGLWPYDSRRKLVRTFWLSLILILNGPHSIGLIFDMANMDELMEHLCIFLVMIAIFLKHFTLVIAEDKMVIVYEDIANNWLMITDEEEKKILVEYSKRGRLLTIGYISMMTFFGGSFILLPLMPVIFNAIDPLPEPRPYIYILQGEFLIENRDDHFWKIYTWDATSIICIVTFCMSIDSMYMASVEHCSALFAIVTHRLSQLQQTISKDEEDESYDWIVHTVKLHQSVLSFTHNINDSYSICFFCLTIMNMAALPASCVMMIVCLNNPLEFLRWGIVLGALMLHVFVLFWPGQKLVNHSVRLLDDACCNKWYEVPQKTKIILRIFMLRCSQPSLITAGGLVLLNFETYLAVVKTAASYITVLASFR